MLGLTLQQLSGIFGAGVRWGGTGLLYSFKSSPGNSAQSDVWTSPVQSNVLHVQRVGKPRVENNLLNEEKELQNLRVLTPRSVLIPLDSVTSKRLHRTFPGWAAEAQPPWMTNSGLWSLPVLRLPCLLAAEPKPSLSATAGTSAILLLLSLPNVNSKVQ